MSKAIIQGITIILATLLLLSVLAVFLEKKESVQLVEEFADIEVKAYNLYQDVIAVRNAPIGTRVSINVDGDSRIDGNTIVIETDEGTEEYDSRTYIQGEICPGPNEIVRLAGGVAVCCGQCPADIQLEFPDDVMCALGSSSNWLDCEYFTPGSLHSVAIECSDLDSQVSLYDPEGVFMTRASPSAQWGEYLIFELRKSVNPGGYELQIACGDDDDTQRLLVRSGGGAGGGGGGGGGSSGRDSGDDDGGENNGGESSNDSGPECSDGIDNDGDGHIDWPHEPGCIDILDDDETNTATACDDPNDDRYYLYDNTDDINISIYNKQNDQQTFTVTRVNDSKLLRAQFSGEQFYIDDSDLLDVNYSITEACGGVDITYTITNPTNQSVALPKLRVDGFMIDTQGSQYALNTFRGGSGNLLKLRTDGSSGSQQPYPATYAPVNVLQDNQFSVGSSILYPILELNHSVTHWVRRYTSGQMQDTWAHMYTNFADLGTDQETTLVAQEQRQYTVPVRFANSRNWLLTLHPYKQYFHSLYASQADYAAPDRRPVLGLSVGNPALVDSDNPRGYLPNYRLDQEGWTRYVDNLITNATYYGYNRTHIWVPQGRYNESVWCNQPPPFMSGWLPQLVATEGDFAKLAQNNIDLGFWWGRAGQVPQPIDQWNPESCPTANTSNTEHYNFLVNELMLAYQRGATDIGLDTVSQMLLNQRYAWVDDMKDLTNNEVNFAHEVFGPDIMHSKIANFQAPARAPTGPWNLSSNADIINGPDVLSRYLNGPSEIWLWMELYRDELDNPFDPSYELLQTWTSWDTLQFRIPTQMTLTLADRFMI